MFYILKSGFLYEESTGAKVAQIKNNLCDSKKNIFLLDESNMFQTDVIVKDDTDKKQGDVRTKSYLLNNMKNDILIKAEPQYAETDNPDLVGWPISHLPKVDHATVKIGNISYELVMHNSQNYALVDENKDIVMQIMHQGIMGGWKLDSKEEFSPEMLCGLFVFCRYIEQENEFMVV